MDSRDQLISESDQLAIPGVVSALELLYKQPRLRSWEQAAPENGELLEHFRQSVAEVAKLGQSTSPPEFSRAVNVFGQMVSALQMLSTRLRSSVQELYGTEMPHRQHDKAFLGWHQFLVALGAEV